VWCNYGQRFPSTWKEKKTNNPFWEPLSVFLGEIVWKLNDTNDAEVENRLLRQLPIFTEYLLGIVSQVLDLGRDDWI